MLLATAIEHYLQDRKKEGLERTRKLVSANNTLDFSANDYLSLANDAQVKQAYQTGLTHYPVGSGGSMVLSGYHAIHHELEQTFAQALQVENCILFSSGYMANLSIMRFLEHFGAEFLIDKGVHASVYDGLRSAKGKFRRFRHNDWLDFSKKLETSDERTVVVTESLFSMSGLIAPLKQMSTLIQAKQSILIVDEAHGFGVLGPQGLGGVFAAGLTANEVPLRMIPFGKALGGHGAIVAGRSDWVEALLQASRAPIYSTAMSPAYAYGLLQTLKIVLDVDDRRAHLQDLITYFRYKIQNSALHWRDSYSPIQQLQLGCPFAATQYSQSLAMQGLRCFAIREPTVTKQETGLRVILNFHHQKKDIDQLFQALEACKA